MQQKTLWILLAALVVQLGLFFALHGRGPDLAAYQGDQPLLGEEIRQADRLLISDSDGQHLKLQKQGESWSLPDHFGTKADSEQIKSLIDKLAEIKRPWPVADSAEVAKRFKVAEQRFEKQIEFFRGDKSLASLLIGSSPGFRKVHARRKGEQEIYDIKFSSYEASTKPADWVDKGQLKLDAQQVKALELNGLRLERKGETLELAGLGAQERTKRTAADSLLSRLTELRILDVVDRPQQSQEHADALLVELEKTDGSKRQYQFFTVKGSDGKSDEGLLLVSDSPLLFSVSASLQGELEKIDRATLVEAKTEPESGEEK